MQINYEFKTLSSNITVIHSLFYIRAYVIQLFTFTSCVYWKRNSCTCLVQLWSVCIADLETIRITSASNRDAHTNKIIGAFMMHTHQGTYTLHTYRNYIKNATRGRCIRKVVYALSQGRIQRSLIGRAWG